MSKLRLEKDIKEIIDASKDQIFFHNVSEDDIREDQQFPVVLSIVTTSAILEEMNKRTFAVNLIMLQPEPVRENCDNDETYQFKMITIQDEHKEIIEQMIHYLSSINFKYPYELQGDIEFEDVDDFTEHSLVGVNASFSLAEQFTRGKCCIDFDESKLK